MLPRLYREAPVNAIWEGSGNVMCLDVLRALARDGEPRADVLDELAARHARSARRTPEAAGYIRTTLASDGRAEAKARAAVGSLAMLAAAAALREGAAAQVARFLRARGSRNLRPRCMVRAISALPALAIWSRGHCRLADGSPRNGRTPSPCLFLS